MEIENEMSKNIIIDSSPLLRTDERDFTNEIFRPTDVHCTLRFKWAEG